jgi:hypothetical protein
MQINFHQRLSLLLIICFMLSINLSSQLSCNTDAECNNGKCSSNQCKCDAGYTTYMNQTCNYKQKEKLTAFLLSFLVGAFGADWFYLADGKDTYIVAGVFKLLTGVFCIIGSCFLGCTVVCMKNDKCRIMGTVSTVIIIVLVILSTLTNAIWYLVDWIRVLCDTFKDGNGVDLKSW